jgi:hypothetical protein
VYHVHFNKALPAQGAALAADLKKQDPKAPQPGHVLLLRHQEGDDSARLPIRFMSCRCIEQRRDTGDQLAAVLSQPNAASKIPVSHVTLTHLEGGPWQFLSLDRYNSWQDFGASEGASVPTTGSGKDGWSEVRQHSAYHTDTLADRIAPK